MRNAEAFTDTGDHLRLSPTFGTEGMIDACGLNSARPRGRSEEQQCEAIGTPGDGHADARICCDQGVEISSKSFDQGVLGDHPERL